MSSYRIHKESNEKILNILATPTEYDEFNYPKEFTLKKDSVGTIFVASDEALIYTKVLSGVETRNDGIVVIGSENWLDKADLELFERRGVVLASPNFARSASRNYQAFARRYIKKHGVIPSEFARTGFECMLLFGQQLKKNGVYFQEALQREAFIPGFLSEGFNYQDARDNQVVPFIHFEEGELVPAVQK